MRIVEPAAGVSVIITLPVFHARGFAAKMRDGIHEFSQNGSAKREKERETRAGKDEEGNKSQKPAKP
jgi:hypothetical protein